VKTPLIAAPEAIDVKWEAIAALERVIDGARLLQEGDFDSGGPTVQEGMDMWSAMFEHALSLLSPWIGGVGCRAIRSTSNRTPSFASVTRPLKIRGREGVTRSPVGSGHPYGCEPPPGTGRPSCTWMWSTSRLRACANDRSIRVVVGPSIG
jgi:hypothetical protein